MEPIQVGEHTFIGVEVKLPKTTLLTTPTPVVTSCVVCLRWDSEIFRFLSRKVKRDKLS
ncbi:hypothetical protein [Paenibacillus polymyxa]